MPGTGAQALSPQWDRRLANGFPTSSNVCLFFCAWLVGVPFLARLSLRWIDVPVLPIFGRRDARMMCPLFCQRQRPVCSGANDCVSRGMLCTCCVHASLVQLSHVARACKVSG